MRNFGALISKMFANCFMMADDLWIESSISGKSGPYKVFYLEADDYFGVILPSNPNPAEGHAQIWPTNWGNPKWNIRSLLRQAKIGEYVDNAYNRNVVRLREGKQPRKIIHEEENEGKEKTSRRRKAVSKKEGNKKGDQVSTSMVWGIRGKSGKPNLPKHVEDEQPLPIRGRLSGSVRPVSTPKKPILENC